MRAGFEDAAGTPEISVILACDGVTGRFHETIRAIADSCTGMDAEIIVVHSPDSVVSLPGSLSVQARSIEVPSDLVPELWGRGVAAARGAVFALTTTQFRVDIEWARELLTAIRRQSVAGVGGRMALSPGMPLLTRAVFMIRYSEHLGTDASMRPRDIAGDNAAYVRQAVTRNYPDVASGFWEVDAHRLMRAGGESFGRAPNAVAWFEAAGTLREMIINRFVHGSHYGSYRVRELGWPQWRAIAVTPLVPFLLLSRILARIRRGRHDVAIVIPAIPLMLVLLVAWAAGEARGAIAVRRGADNA